MTNAEMRKYLSGLYPGKKWRLRVAAMSEAQVFVVYTKLKLEGRL